MQIPRHHENLSHDQIRDLVGADALFVLEIGCNDGTDTLEMMHRFPHARIDCFECDPRAIAKFRTMVRANWALCDSRVFLHEVALSSTGGSAQFHQSDGKPDSPQVGWDKSGSLCKPTGHLTRSPEITFPSVITVRTRSLDGIMKDLRVFPQFPDHVIDFIRLDVQGHERAVFAGGVQTLARTRWMLAECHRGELYEGQFSEKEMIEYLGATGWKCRGRWADDLLFSKSRIAAIRGLE